MKPVALGESDLNALRAIARAGFDYEATKRIGADSGWKLVEDDGPSLVQYRVKLPGTQGGRRLLSVCGEGAGAGPCAFVPLFYFDDEDEDDPGDAERSPFDRAFRRLADAMTDLLGPPFRAGEYRYPHRADWDYHYCWWRLEDASVALVQDEHDIQFGMDVSLWVLPAGIDVAVPLGGD